MKPVVLHSCNARQDDSFTTALTWLPLWGHVGQLYTVVSIVTTRGQPAVSCLPRKETPQQRQGHDKLTEEDHPFCSHHLCTFTRKASCLRTTLDLAGCVLQVTRMVQKMTESITWSTNLARSDASTMHRLAVLAVLAVLTVWQLFGRLPPIVFCPVFERREEVHADKDRQTSCF